MDEKEAEARPLMGTIFLVSLIWRAKRAPHWGVQSRFRVIYIICILCMSVCLVCQINCVGGITLPTRMLKVIFGR